MTEKIKIITNYQNDELYSISKDSYKDLGFEMIGVDGKNKFYGFPFFDYMVTDSKFKDIDWIIYLDEDCFVSDKQALIDLLEYQIKNNIHCSGVPDGGVISHRFHNPVSIIAFFMILNVGAFRDIYNSEQVTKMRYGKDLDKFIPHDLINDGRPFNEKFIRTIADGYTPYGVLYDDFEPTYRLFFWMLRNGFNIKYLNAYDYPNDDYTTVVKNHKNEDFVYHTWFARHYNDIVQRERILNIKNYTEKLRRMNEN